MTRGGYDGIVANDYAKVMNEDNEPIEGLYAADLISSGDMTGGFYPAMEALACLLLHGVYRWSGVGGRSPSRAVGNSGAGCLWQLRHA